MGGPRALSYVGHGWESLATSAGYLSVAHEDWCSQERTPMETGAGTMGWNCSPTRCLRSPHCLSPWLLWLERWLRGSGWL